MLADRRDNTPIIVLYDEDKERLLDDILSYKRDVDFKPNYVIAPKTETTQKRPKEFEGGFEEWLYSVKAEHKKELEERVLWNKQREQRDFAINVDYANHIMSKFMRIN